MKKSKHLLGLCVASLVTLSACSTASTNEGESGRNITFTFWGNDQEADTLKAMVAEFEKAHPDTDVRAEWVQGDFEQLLQTRIAGGEQPTTTMISNGGLASFRESFQPVEVDPLAYLSDNIPTSMQYEDQYYAVPFVVKPKMMAINAKLFADNNVPRPSESDPMSIADFAAAAKKLTSGSGKSKIYGSSPLFWQNWVTVMGGGLFDAAGTECAFASQEGIDAAEFVVESQSADGFAPAPLDAEGQDMFGWFTVGRLAMLPDFGPWNIASLAELDNPDFKLVPVPGNGQPLEVNGVAISKTAEGSQLEAATEFAEFMSTDPAAQSLLTNEESSLGVPVVESAVSSFESVAPDLNLAGFVAAIDQSEVPPAVKQQVLAYIGDEVSSETTLGTGSGDPAVVLPELQQECQSMLDRG